MENLHGRLDYVTSTLHFLNASLGNFCDGRQDSFTLATNVLDYDLITIIGTLVTSPYIEKADVCRWVL
ncbi:hypothetical protein DPMN_098277 [Dreissena polymorpha]|uniref:Uncharacterized protein n=1 Tax=Dreissena polymorpha TaxID=45954 RepID=A0A9D4R6I5_DREPO|nr:hypothetical protein DPMN_098277 [Dreissena polymorpha]